MAWEPAWNWLLLCAFIAEAIGTMAGFGAATILTPVAASFIDIKSAVALVAVFHLFGNISRLIFFGKKIDWKCWIFFGVTGILCSFIGARLAGQLSAAAVKGALGLFLVVYVILTVTRMDQALLPKRRATLIGGGILSGFIAGLIGTGGAIRSACLLAFQLPKEAYIGTSAAIALCVDSTRIPVYVIEGLIPSTMRLLLAALIPVAFSGAWLGQWLVKQASPKTFKILVLAVLFLMGLKLFWEGWHGR